MPIQAELFFLPALLPEQEFLSAPVPALYGPIEYREWKSQLERIHEVPRLSGGWRRRFSACLWRSGIWPGRRRRIKTNARSTSGAQWSKGAANCFARRHSMQCGADDAGDGQ